MGVTTFNRASLVVIEKSNFLKMKFIIALIFLSAFVTFFQGCDADILDIWNGGHGNCECNLLLLEDRGNRYIGNCQVKGRTNGRYYCYVNPNSQCRDRRPSSRIKGLYYSYDACNSHINDPHPYYDQPYRGLREKKFSSIFTTFFFQSKE